MKKFLALALIIVMALSLVSCGNTYKKATEALMENIPSGYYYSEEQIADVKATHDKHEHFDGEIIAIADFSTISTNGIPLYIYVYEFEKVEDAEYWYDNVSTGWTYARIKNNVVIYGTNAIINDIKL